MAIIIKADILNICECPDTSALPKSIGKAEHEQSRGTAVAPVQLTESSCTAGADGPI